jgi:hypothetical protein
VARSTDIQARSPRNGGGYGNPPHMKGERRAETHGAFITKFTPREQAEIDELADEIRQLVPVSPGSGCPAPFAHHATSSSVRAAFRSSQRSSSATGTKRTPLLMRPVAPTPPRAQPQASPG